MDSSKYLIERKYALSPGKGLHAYMYKQVHIQVQGVQVFLEAPSYN